MGAESDRCAGIRDPVCAAADLAQDAAVRRLIVVGIGADGTAGLAPASRAELARATVVYGSERQLELLDGSVTAARRTWPSPLLAGLGDALEATGR